MSSRFHHNAGSRDTLIQCCYCGAWRCFTQMARHTATHNPHQLELIKEEMDRVRDRVGRAKKQKLRRWF